MRELWIPSSFDGSAQPSLFYRPATRKTVPLVVGLHTWSYSRDNQREHYLPRCEQYGWALLLPEFRGPNLASNPRPELACGSIAARRDVIDAVRHVAEHEAIDPERLFLLGCSGGGQMALLAALSAPRLFRGIEVWCPVTDLAGWHDHLARTGQRYAYDLETCLRGTPESHRNEYGKRSPAVWPEQLAQLPLRLHHGRHDEIVPYQHSLTLALEIEKHAPRAFYYDIFDGGHEQFPDHSFEWFARLAGANDTGRRITG